MIEIDLFYKAADANRIKNVCPPKNIIHLHRYPLYFSSAFRGIRGFIFFDKNLKTAILKQ